MSAIWAVATAAPTVLQHTWPNCGKGNKETNSKRSIYFKYNSVQINNFQCTSYNKNVSEDASKDKETAVTPG